MSSAPARTTTGTARRAPSAGQAHTRPTNEASVRTTLSQANGCPVNDMC